MNEVGSPKDDSLELPSDTLALLEEFYSDRESREKRLEDLKCEFERKSSQTQLNIKLSMEMFTEDWNASQFWYSEETAITLAKQLLQGSTPPPHSICIVSAPSEFVQLKNLMSSGINQDCNVSLLEFDNRFDIFKEFVHYDFEHPLTLPDLADMKGKYDCVLCDPPFLSPDCQTKAAMTVRWLSKIISPVAGSSHQRVVICTGERMEGLILKLYPGIKTTTFVPQHAQDRLSKDFRCYANFECSTWSWR